MKVAISLPDPLFQAAERLARRLKKPRSRLYAEALSEYVDAHGIDGVREQLDAVYAAESSRLDKPLEDAQSRILDNEAW